MSREATDALVEDLQRVFGDRLQSVVAYGSGRDGHSGEAITCLALVSAIQPEDLEQCARRSFAWRRRGLATPLILPGDEFKRSLDAFPLEYDEIIRTHVCVFGPEPFDGLSIATEDLRRACETQVKSHLVHLRQGFIEAGDRPREIADVVAASAPSFAALLKNVARFHRVPDADEDSTIREGARLAGLSPGIVSAVLALDRPRSMGATDAARMFADYLAAVEQLARFVDSWKQT